MKRSLAFATLVVLAALVPGLLVAQSNPAVGTWKLNLKKSKSTTTPLPQSDMLTVEARGNGVKVDYDGVDANGVSYSYGYVANFDGKDSPIFGSGQPADTISIERTDMNTYESTLKKGDQIVAKVETAVSKNGKVTTLTIKGTGQPTTDVRVYDKQ
jgi:hypothetical protein